MPTGLIALVEAWATANDTTRSEAIRRLVERGLTVSKTATDGSRPNSIAKPGRRTRAKQLAKDAIEKMADPTASREERTQRRHRLTKGPEEFRGVRVDLPKRKP